MTEGARPLVDDFVVLLLLWLETPDIPLTPLTLLPALLLEEIAWSWPRNGFRWNDGHMMFG